MRNRLLEYASWKIISKYQDSETGKVDGLRFNKMMVLLNHKLLGDRNLELRLPRNWYFYGQQVVPKELPANVRVEGLGEDAVKTQFRWDGDRPKLRTKQNRRKIDSAVDWLFTSFPPSGSIFEAVGAGYEFAPFEFQRLYATFRSDFRLRSVADRQGLVRAKILAIEFDRAIKSFPTDQFPSLKVPAKKLEFVVSALLDEFPTSTGLAIELAVSLWEIFCKFLRAQPEGHKYVSRERVDYWRRNASDELEVYQTAFHEQVTDILERLKPGGLSDPMVRAFLQPVDLGEGYTGINPDIDQITYG